MVIWLVGLSGSGKTTLGRSVADAWRSRAPNTVFLDGDELREVFKADKGDAPFTIEGRRRNSDRLVALCELLDRQGINVVCCILSIFPKVREKNRTRFSRYFEIFMDAPLESLKRRDVKGLYAMADRGEMRNVVGLDIPFEPPVSADMVVDSAGDRPDIEALTKDVLKAAEIS
ncbi:MAG: adenylyl-sulfate kinase [Pseudomonadota bacterium]